MSSALGQNGDRRDLRVCRPPAVLVSRAGIAGFLIVLGLEHLLAPGLYIGRDRISEYAVRGVGWLMVAGFVAWSVALAASAMHVRAAVRGARGFALAALLVVAAGGILVTASFPTQAVHGKIPAGTPHTIVGDVHDLGSGAVFLALVAAALLSMVTIPRVRVVASIAISVGYLARPSLALAGFDVPALAQRLAVLSACVWLWALAGALARERPQARGLVYE